MSTLTAQTAEIEQLDELRIAAGKASTMLKSLSNDHRLMILCLLIENEMSVSQLNQVIEIGQSPLSQHLARLRQDGLVKTRKESQTVYYSIDSDEAKQIIQVLHSIYCP
jgi:DNA-binding transcriptional ArsR family regulator